MIVLLVVVPVYALIRTVLLQKMPGRMLVTSVQRMLTCIALVILNPWPSYQVLALYAIQVGALYFLFPRLSSTTLRAFNHEKEQM
jgi:hypothetical protein